MERVTMTERDFISKRIVQRADELRRQHQGDHATYLVELGKVLLSTARNERERRDAEAMLNLARTSRRFGLFDKD
jgi:hypothetical protein